MQEEKGMIIVLYRCNDEGKQVNDLIQNVMMDDDVYSIGECDK
jgi:hypothetical protein